MHRWSDLPELRTGVLRRRVRAWAGPGSGPGPDIAMAAAYAAVVGAFLDEAVYTVGMIRVHVWGSGKLSVLPPSPLGILCGTKSAQQPTSS